MGQMIYATEARLGDRLKWCGTTHYGAVVQVVRFDEDGNPFGSFVTYPKEDMIGIVIELNRHISNWERLEDPFVQFVREVLENHADDRSTGG